MHFFSFSDGLDPKVCEVLNVRVQQIAKQYNQTIKDYDDKIIYLEEVISKYKRLAPKSKILCLYELVSI